VRIALTHAYCWPDIRRGAERYLPSLGAALARRGHEVVHYTSSWKAGADTEGRLTTVRLRRRFTDTLRHEADFGRRITLPLLRRRFDVVHSFQRWDAVASLRAARVHRSRRTVFTDLGLPTPSWWQSLGPREVRATERVVRDVGIYLGLSRCAVDRLASEYGRTDGVVLPGGVDTSAFVPAEERAPRPTILFSGAFDVPYKQVAVLLAAMPAIAEAESDVELWLSGPGDGAALLAQAPPEARDRTRILGLGDIERQHERYGRAWVTCLPSSQEAFGLVLVESLACGTPLVTTTEGGPQELVETGRTGELAQAGDPSSLAAACLRALALAREPGTAVACRRSAERYDWEQGVAPLAERIYSGEVP